MNLRSISLSLALVAVTATSANLFAQGQPAPGAAPGGGGPGGGGPGGRGPGAPRTELGDRMSAISDIYRPLGSQITNMTMKADSIAKVTLIRSNFLAAAKLTPMYLTNSAVTNKEVFMADFKKEMDKMQTTIDSLVTALNAGNAADAQKFYAAMGEVQRESHAEFRAPRGRGRGGAGGAGGPGGAPGGAPGGGGAGAPGGGAPRGN